VEPILNKLLKGKYHTVTAVECTMIMAEEIALRGKINLHSTLMDTPDQYWEEHELEKIFESMRDHLDVTRRIETLNERLEHLHHMVDVLKHDRQDRLSTNLELWIIVLIFVEIVCSLLEKSEKYEQFRWEPFLNRLLSHIGFGTPDYSSASPNPETESHNV
jgi:hypothetical protein